MKLNRKKYTVLMMSRTLGVSSSGYYKWLQTSVVKSCLKNKLDNQIVAHFKKSHKTYGSPRIASSLADENIKISKSTVARRMRKLNLTARPKRKYVVTTDSSHGEKIAANLLKRQFTVSKINTVWVSDITYVRVSNKWMYLTTIMDLADRMIVAWTLSNNMSSKDTTINAFNKAVKSRRITRKSKLMFHSDRGVQYASEDFRTELRNYGCIQSMSRRGNCWDNAVAESFFKTIKTEALNRYTFSSKTVLERIIFRYIDGFYNTVRKHSALGGISPLMAWIRINKLAA